MTSRRELLHDIALGLGFGLLPAAVIGLAIVGLLYLCGVFDPEVTVRPS